MIKQYLHVIKPVIVLSNVITFIGGFLLASNTSKTEINYLIFFATLIGVSLVVASGCVFNNFIDRDIDRKMERTKNRTLAKRLLPITNCLIYATILGITGIILLYISANLLAMWLAVIGFIVYVGFYSMYMKRRYVYSTMIGSLAGAVPPVIGYCVVSNKFDTGALILLLIFSIWQMPHSYAIAIFRLKDYETASIPVFPIKRGIAVTKNHITLYIIGFMFTTIMLFYSGYATSYQYLIVMTLVNIWWLLIALQGYKYANNDQVWARQLFILSIIAIISLSVMMSVDGIMLVSHFHL
ncbi:protoheme IX farnesyltransferase [Candidatus Palibaumannia cicadellinicola]|uniref:Protoheme IX farnesyltransferase n=1 Tax=Candidatus Palibaumannia cicadellinicola TaxID=186490 RepID=A0A2N4XWV4_9GAMM|nr:heme o synthase [Candidatus Baumannia cicadellinicola]PLK58394.1 protoheme IX farnesyltransferase [Candidatus Baumannia cicadellinicola]